MSIGGSKESMTALLGGSLVICLLYFIAGSVRAQGPPPIDALVPPRQLVHSSLLPRQNAPIDLTGRWVSLVTQDWRWRMLTPARGDYQSVPLNQKAYDIALSWDPVKDEIAAEQCKSYGAAALMSVPTRLNISWQDATTLKVETDAGMQTRRLHFDSSNVPKRSAPSWQGDSVATWLIFSLPASQPSGTLKVTTTNLRPGYLRKNGIPYSADTRLTEYWHLVRMNDGKPLIVITSIVHDPIFLQNDWITTLQFKKEPDGSKWDPQPCSARW